MVLYSLNRSLPVPVKVRVKVRVNVPVPVNVKVKVKVSVNVRSTFGRLALPRIFPLDLWSLGPAKNFYLSPLSPKIVALLCKISRSKTPFLVKYRILMLCFYVKYRVLRFFFVSLHPKYHRYG